MNNNTGDGALAWVTGEAPPTELTSSENSSSYIIVIIITVSASACLLIAAPILFATIKSKKKAQRAGKYNNQCVFFFPFSIYLGPDKEENLPDVLLEKGDFPMNYIYTFAATSIIFFIVNVFIMLWYIVRKRNKARKFYDLDILRIRALQFIRYTGYPHKFYPAFGYDHAKNMSLIQFFNFQSSLKLDNDKNISLL